MANRSFDPPQRRGARGDLGHGKRKYAQRAKRYMAHVHVTMTTEQRDKLMILAGAGSVSEYIRGLIDRQRNPRMMPNKETTT